MKKSIIGILTVLAFVGSFLLANHFSSHDINLYSEFNRVTHWIESLFSKEIMLNEDPVNTTDVIAKSTSRVKKPYQHVEVGHKQICKDTSLGKVSYKKVGEVYTWVDDRGIANFSSTPPKIGDFFILGYAGEKVFDYFTLNLNSTGLPYDFSQKITAKLNKLFEVYGQLLDRSLLKKVNINLRIYASKTAFEQIKAKHNLPVGNGIPGFYSHGTNQAHILLTKPAATMRTATHEATHAINRGIVGYSPKWLNEGLAEYSEYIDIKGQVGKVYPHKIWTDKNLLTVSVLPLSRLFSATNNDWNSTLKTKLYATSWAFIYFMMDDQQRKNLLAKVVKVEQKNLCDLITLQQLEETLKISVPSLQLQFSHWVKQKMKAHQI